jgi:hypothetical protein
MPELMPGHPTPYGADRQECPRCTRSSYSFASFGWCPWCDKAAPEPSPRVNTDTIATPDGLRRVQFPREVETVDLGMVGL